jgi:hypothetical protein
VRGWRLWSLPRGAVVCLLLVEAAAVASTAVFGSLHPISGHRLGYFGAIVAMGLVFAEATRGVERMRRWFSNTPHVNMSSVWTLSAALLTTPLLAAIAPVAVPSRPAHPAGTGRPSRPFSIGNTTPGRSDMPDANRVNGDLGQGIRCVAPIG